MVGMPVAAGFAGLFIVVLSGPALSAMTGALRDALPAIFLIWFFWVIDGKMRLENTGVRETSGSLMLVCMKPSPVGQLNFLKLEKAKKGAIDEAVKKIFKVVQTIEVSEVRGDAATLLKVREGLPALLLHRLLIGFDASPIAYTRLLGIGRQYKIQTEFERLR